VADTLGKTLKNLPGPVLITGHTGFKGTWMTLMLKQLDIPVIGYSLKPETDSLYNRAKLKGQIPEIFADIRDYKKLKKFISKHQPSVVIHMAAQPLVLEAYRIPRETFDVNVMGTVNLLDIAFNVKSVQVVMVVTSDKVYKNDNSGYSFLESDPLEGKDPYSASKVGTESVVNAWQQIAVVSGGPKVVSVRAGNVIGGGDLARNRLMPDIVRSHLSREPLMVRNPNNSRPWQHVLDPLTGYIKVIEKLLSGYELKTVNFGPVGKSLSAQEVIKVTSKAIDFDYRIEKIEDKYESKSLDLNSNYAYKVLNWLPVYNQEEAILKTVEWWQNAIRKDMKVIELCRDEIKDFIDRLTRLDTRK
jgi:CDP-glucose 4,6-dehydratase